MVRPKPRGGGAAAKPSPRDALARDWREAQREGSREAYARFLETHPEGEEAEAARKLLEELAETDEEAEERLSRSKRKALDRYRKMLEGK